MRNTSQDNYMFLIKDGWIQALNAKAFEMFSCSCLSVDKSWQSRSIWDSMGGGGVEAVVGPGMQLVNALCRGNRDASVYLCAQRNRS